MTTLVQAKRRLPAAHGTEEHLDTTVAQKRCAHNTCKRRPEDNAPRHTVGQS
jgi:hypothetical protein